MASVPHADYMYMTTGHHLQRTEPKLHRIRSPKYTVPSRFLSLAEYQNANMNTNSTRKKKRKRRSWKERGTHEAESSRLSNSSDGRDLTLLSGCNVF